MNVFAASSLLCGASAVSLAIFSVIAGHGRAYRVLTWFNVAVIFWGTGCFIAAISYTESMALFGWKFAHTGGFFIAPLFYHLVTELCGCKQNHTRFLAYFQGALFNLLNIGSSLVMNKTRLAFGVFYNEATLLYAVAVFCYLLLVTLSYVELIRFFKIADDSRRIQARYIFFGFMFGFVGGTTTLLPEFGVDAFHPIGNIGVFIYVTIVTYAILRHNILDLERVAWAIQRERLATVGILATSINHEIRNPLYIIKGFAESYLENLEQGNYSSKEEVIEKSKEVISKSKEQAERAMEIMHRFTLFAKPSLNQAQIDVVNLMEALEDVFSLVHHELELDKIELIKEIPNNLPSIRADRRHIEEIFFNLIVNACQAMKNGGQLTVRAEQRNGKVQVEIQDQGPGIPPEQLSKIFEPFYTTKDSGTGLGLYITKQLVERNKGKISVESQLNKGTRFILSFPA